jgi:hypothetical protein
VQGASDLQLPDGAAASAGQRLTGETVWQCMQQLRVLVWGQPSAPCGHQQRLQQPRLQQHQWALRGRAGQGQVQYVWRLPGGPVLLQGLTDTALEAAQACVQGPGSSTCRCRALKCYMMAPKAAAVPCCGMLCCGIMVVQPAHCPGSH